MNQDVLYFIPETLYSRNFLIRDQAGAKLGIVEYPSMRPTAIVRFGENERFLSRQALTVFRARYDFFDDWKLHEGGNKAEARIATAERWDAEQLEVTWHGGKLYIVADSMLPLSVKFGLILAPVNEETKLIGSVVRDPSSHTGFVLTCDSIIRAPIQLFLFTLAQAQILYLNSISSPG